MIKYQHPYSGIYNAPTHCPYIPSFNRAGLTVPEERVWWFFKTFLMFENWRERKMNKDTDKHWQHDSINPMSTFVPSFYFVGITVPEKSVRKCSSVLHWWERNGKKMKTGKKMQNKAAYQFSFLQDTWPFSMCVQNLKALALIGLSWEMCEKIWWRERLMEE